MKVNETKFFNLGELTAVYTPNKTITASEVLSDGKYVVVALEGTTKLIILRLIGPAMESFCIDENNLPSRQEYGIPENYGKVFDLNYSLLDR